MCICMYVEKLILYKLCAVKWKVDSTDQLHQQYEGGTPSVDWRVCSTDESHHHYGGETLSMMRRVCSIDQLHYHYRRRCEVQD